MRWAQWEIDFLIESDQVLSLGEMQQKLHRSKDSLQGKRRHLGLQRSSDYIGISIIREADNENTAWRPYLSDYLPWTPGKGKWQTRCENARS